MLCDTNGGTLPNEVGEIVEKVCKYISIKTKNKNYDSFLEGNLPETIWTLKIKPTKK